MERPLSRGLLAAGVPLVSGGGMQAPERPGTGSSSASSSARQPASLPPGTASSRGISTPMRGGGGPPGTAFRRVAAGASGSQQQQQQLLAQAQARPLTAQGMGGLKPSGVGGGRQVLDRAYFLNELRHKRQEVVAATQQMREELEVLAGKKTSAARAEQLAAQLRKEVRLLQEALADNNIIIDKASSHAPLQHIHAELSELRGHNKAQQVRLEELLSQRLELEQRGRQVEAETASIQAAFDAQLASMAPRARAAYSDLLAERDGLLGESGRLAVQLDELGAALEAAEGELSRNSLKQRVLQLQEQLKLLAERKQALAAAEEASKAPPEQQREALLAGIKRDDAALQHMAEEAKRLQEAVQALEARRAAGGGSGRADRVEDPAARERYAQLLAKEREVGGFVDALPHRRAAKAGELAAKQEAVTAALARISQLRAGAGGLQAQGGEQRQQQPGGAAGPEGVRAELAARRAELARVEGLASKIDAELAGLRDSLAALQAETDVCADVEGARAAKGAATDALAARRDELAASRDALTAALADASWQVAALEAQLKEHPAWPTIERLEAQQRALQAQLDETAAAIAGYETSRRGGRGAAGELLPQLAAAVDGANAALVAAL